MRKMVHVRQEHIDRGECHNPFKCPIALAMNNDTGELYSVGVDSYHIEDSPRDFPRLLPRRAKQFIKLFDNKKPVIPFNFYIEIDK